MLEREGSDDTTYLVPLDPELTAIGPAGGSHESSDGSVQVGIRAGALSSTIQVRSSAEPDPVPWPDGERDRASYHWHRYYDPQTGRYVSGDPVGQAAGINTYLYGSATPTSSADPYGAQAQGVLPWWLADLGMHYDVKSRGGPYGGSIVCCPCCTDTAGGPVPGTSCGIVW